MADKARYHTLVRTNAKGIPFVGRCIQCGKEGLTAEETFQLCDNPKGVTEEQSLIDVIEGNNNV